MFDKFQEKWFQSIAVSKLFHLSKLFYDNYHVPIFDYKNPKITQIEDYARANIKEITIDPLHNDDENLKLFLSSAQLIIDHDYKQYTDAYVVDLVNMFLEWRSFQDGLTKAIEFQKITKVTNSDEMRTVVAKCKEFFHAGVSVRLDNDLGVDFEDPDAHIQPPQGDLMNSGFSKMNEWLCGNSSGGFEKGTTTLFISLPNIGKSIFLSNIAFNMYINGHNVLLVSLEMSTWKIFRRIGANAFDVNMHDYENMAANPAQIAERMREFKEKSYTTAIPLGTLKAKRYAHATVDDVMALAHKLEEKYEIKFEAIVIDYFTELQNKYGIKSNEMYSYHKQNMDDMYNAGVEYDKAMISAHQIKVNGDMQNMSLSSLSESTAIAFRPDNIFAIIQPPIMKQQGEYMLKNIKARDSEFKDFRTTFGIDYTKMRLIAKNDNIAPDMF